MAFTWLPWRRKPAMDGRQLEKDFAEIRQAAPVPCLWLFGKTGSGKTSVIHYLTGAEEAIIGEGFRPETKTSRRFDFPDSLDPLLRFLDTRGLAEATYDPTDDIQQFSQSTQMIIVTVRVTDHALSNLIPPLRKMRRASPQTPICWF
jgi:predicted GTPase